MNKEAYVITWPVKDKNDWLPCPEDCLVPKLQNEFEDFISNKKYLSINLNLILMSENVNCGLFLDTKTGDWVGLGIFYEKDLMTNPAIRSKLF